MSFQLNDVVARLGAFITSLRSPVVLLLSNLLRKPKETVNVRNDTYRCCTEYTGTASCFLYQTSIESVFIHR